ncbi:MAG TPA: hypothetical protein VMS12_01755 [Thermoanaerobaculia bacterium]|nr:hypothetical protein [Thermoanaerobaculia bacterium]
MRRSSAVAPLVFALVVLAVSCGRGEVSAGRWTEMTHEQKTLIVKSMLGAEMVAARKGGTRSTYSGFVEDYLRRIDEAYERGDDRPVEQIWPELADAG